MTTTGQKEHLALQGLLQDDTGSITGSCVRSRRVKAHANNMILGDTPLSQEIQDTLSAISDPDPEAMAGTPSS